MSALPPPPPPPPPPAQVNYNTPEFRQSDGAEFHGADAAWEDGSTGEGEIIAIVDSGIDSDSPEFEGRIHSASQDVAGNRGIDPVNDHGTNVALVAAAARNDSGVLGIAFDAQLLAIRADLPGSCGADSPQDASQGCVFTDGAIARGVDLAIDQGASVINLSLGGEAASTQLLDAVRRASDAGIVVVVAAGNNGDGSDPLIDPNQPNPFATSLLQAGNGNVIIVGSVNTNGAFSSFSNRAGNSASFFISARGERICCAYQDGELFVETINGQDYVTLISGTSFAAPQVSGAVALLAQAFPNLTAQEIVEILLDSARDVGSAGDDVVFGTGILDIASAFEPKGTTSVAGSQRALSTGDGFAIGSAVMGDALSGVSLNTIITDKYDRAYTLDLGQRARNGGRVQRLRNAIGKWGHTRSVSTPALSFSVTAQEGERAAGLNWSDELHLTAMDAERARVLAARMAARVAPDLQVGFAISQSGNGLVAQLQDANRPAFRIAAEAGQSMGFAYSSDIAAASRFELDGFGLTVLAERGEAWLGDYREIDGNTALVREQRPTMALTFAVDRQWRGLDASVSMSWLSEEASLLGAYFNPAVGIDGADTLFLDGRVSTQIAGNWRLGAAYRAGFTNPRGGEQLIAGSQIVTQSWSFDATRYNTLIQGDSLGLRISQPLRVNGGHLYFELPVAYDYASESAIFGVQSLSLTPEGREIMGEVNWSATLPVGSFSVSAYIRKQPGHFRNAPDDTGMIFTLGSTF